MSDDFFFREMEYPVTGKPDFYAPMKHRGTRRASWHDYSSRCIYMITISRNHHWKKELTRRGALWMNDLARYIAAQDEEGWVLERKTGE